jgi:DNA-binding beta-propeller fold protein YncE
MKTLYTFYSRNTRCSALFVLLAASLMAAGGYHLIQKIPVPGDYGWDYLTADSEGRRLYVSHDREVVVLDLDSGAIVGKIPGSDVHGIAIVRDLGRGFISATDPGSVTIFDLKTLAVIGKVPVGADPNAILYDRKTRRVFTVDRGSKQVTAIDAKTGKVVGTIENLGGRTEHAASDDAGHIFLNMQDRHTLLKLDSQALKVLETWPLAPCEQPSSMDMDRAHQRVFIGCRSGVMTVVDAATGRIVTTQPIGRGVDATEFDAGRDLIYFSSGGDGTMAVFHEDSPDKYTLVESVKTQTGARTMAIDRKTGRAFLSVAELGPRPAAEPGKPQPRAPMLPGTFSVLMMGRQ